MRQTDYPELDERVYKEVLPNGLTVLVAPKPGFARKLAYFVTDYGSIHREFTLDGQTVTAPEGVAHYLEHKMFDLPGRDVSAEFAALGASDNAFTSYDMTAYFFSCTENFDACLSLLLEFVSAPYFTPETVEKERGIIGQEISMNEDSPDTRGFENLMGAMYRMHPISQPILGTQETIAEITDQVLYNCHRAFYSPNNMVLCVVGDVNPERVAEIARQALPKDPGPVVERSRQWPETMDCPKAYVQDAMEVAMPSFQIGFKCEPLGRGEAAIRQELIGDLAAEALFGESSELYLGLYEQGLIDSSFGGGFETVDGMAMLTCSGDSENPQAVRDAVLARAKFLAETGIPQADFQRMKRSAMGRRIRDLDSFDSTCFRLCAYHFSGFDYFRFPGVYEALEAEEIREFLSRTVTEPRCAISVIVPVEEA